ncbi:hypothetical protein [Mycobacterium avium]|uniref:Uncharacterized protein n=1 Tax=Mycobacterium avium subsp. hominissuis TaxID=439334 RepID=A0AAI8X5G4_MYCAV|nr:hypothetical protein [Mycobacterium avium]BBN50941.1 hypothetical protein JPH1_54160 [Mycobacterium avium subsp. hominissuis]
MDNTTELRKVRTFLIALSVTTIALVIILGLNPLNAMFMVLIYLGVYGSLTAQSLD